ncbi:MAG: hypothetical protein KDK70_11570, partial [Myxococcales bacterium]|nr:hypothetical protein [Myxococcales bacterium]
EAKAASTKATVEPEPAPTTAVSSGATPEPAAPAGGAVAGNAAAGDAAAGDAAAGDAAEGPAAGDAAAGDAAAGDAAAGDAAGDAADPAHATTSPRWTVSCATKGEAQTLTVELRPGVGVLAVRVSDDAGRAYVWPQPQALVLFDDLEQKVLAVHGKPDAPSRDLLRFYALPKTFSLHDRDAEFQARLSMRRLDDEAVGERYDVSCKAHREEGA